MSWDQPEINAANALLTLALVEDLGTRGDLTSQATIPAEATGQADLVVRSAGVIAGLPIAQLIFGQLTFLQRAQDGRVVKPGDVIATVAGGMQAMLSLERVALNFLQRLSGIATLTRRYVEATGGKSKVFDTRKTTPGWRRLEKYAVRCGGGHNHRMGLDDAILIKDNHVAALGGGPSGVAAAIAATRAHAPGLSVEIEVDSFEQFEAALAAKPEIILLDNMNIELMTQCAQRRDSVAPGVQLEASGGINLQTITGIAATGVDRISVGALTHSATALDIALDYRV